MTSTRLWIHIGMPKTGTTSLQDLLAHNREKLSERGYLYPDFGHTQHYPVVRSLAREAGSPAGFPPGGEDLSVSEIRKRIGTQVESRSITDVVLSSEFFFDYAGLTPGRLEFPIRQALPYLRGVASLLRETFADYDARVIVWLRRQDYWLMSMYNNVVKAANYQQDFDTFYKSQVAPWYGSILDQWADIFGSGRIRVSAYERIGEEHDVTRQFLKIIGLPDGTPLETPPPNVREGNISLSPELLVIKRELNKYMPDDMPGLRHRIEDLFFDLARRNGMLAGADYPILSPQRRREIIEKFAEENRRVAEKFFRPSRPSLFLEPPPVDSPWQEFETVSGHTLLQVFAPLVLAQARRIKHLENRINSERLSTPPASSQ